MTELFQLGDFTSHAGLPLKWKIECDAINNYEWDCLATMIMMYQQFIKDAAEEKKNQTRMSRKMGYLGTVNDTKEILEKIFKNNNYQPPQR